MHPFSSLLRYYIALVEDDLPEVEKWSLSLGVNTRFSNGNCSICQFFENSLTAEQKCEVPCNLSDLSKCSCADEANDCSLTSDSCSCDASASDKPGVTALHIACSHAGLAVVNFLLERGAAVNTVTVNLSQTPLQVALDTRTLESVVEICTTLVSYGSHIHSSDGHSPVHIAIRKNSPSVLAALLSAKLKYPDTVQQALATVDEETGCMPLHAAVWCRYLECCWLLIDAGADINAEHTLSQTPLELAVIRGDKDIVQLLLESPNCQIDKVGSNKATALLRATSRVLATLLSAKLKYPDTVQQALATVDEETGCMPLHAAVWCRYLECCWLLIDAGADINAEHTLSQTPLELVL